MGSQIGLILLSFLILSSCLPSKKIDHFRWSALDSVRQDGVVEAPPLPSHLQSLVDHKTPELISYKTEKIRRYQQDINGIELKGGWLQTIHNKNDQIIYAVARTYQNVSPAVRRELKQLVEKKDEYLARTKKKDKDFSQAKALLQVEYDLKPQIFSYSPLMLVTFLTKSEEDVIQLTLDNSGQVVSKKSVAFAAEGLGNVFPNSPDQSGLKEDVPLKNLTGKGLIQGDRLEVENAIGPSAKSADHDFRFQPQDKHFDEVQAYFFVNQAVQWFLKEYNLQLPFRLNVKVHVGGPTPNNTFFYYRGNIRLGDGDGVTYKELVRDPTVVIHETAHAYVDLLSGLSNEGESGSVTEAMSDFFTALILDSPHMGNYSFIGQAYRRTLDNQLTVDQLNGGKYHDSTIVSGTFWDIKKALGTHRSGELAILTLARMGKTGDFESFVSSTLDAARTYFSKDEEAQVVSIFRTRGWID